MNYKQIVFTGPGVAELQEKTLRAAGPGDVLVKTEYTGVSAGTERANLVALPNTAGHKSFPVTLGYSGVGHVAEIGSSVSSVKVGDRVLIYFGTHSSYNLMPEDKVIKVDDDNIDSVEAAFTVIAMFPLSGVRKARIEIGESAMVMGLGILGLFSVQLCGINGAIPVIAADLNPERRKLALSLGADFALDPSAPDFVKQVRSITKGKGVNAVIEVSGASVAMKQALGCAARQARIVLLGCTRVSDCPIDFYQDVHLTGVSIIGAHTSVRPQHDSYPYHWTFRDECNALLKLLSAKRIKAAPVISEVHTPQEAPEVYSRLAYDKNFPVGIVFDWRTTV